MTARSAAAGAMVHRANGRERVDYVKARVGLRDLVGREVELKAAGAGEWSGLCPFHKEKTPSFYVIDRDGERWWHCFGCGQHGDLIGFAMRRWSLDFRAALERLEAGSHSWPAPPARQSPGAPMARAGGTAEREAQALEKRRQAAAIARATLALMPDDIVDRYLRGRDLKPPHAGGANGGWPAVLRLHPSLPYFVRRDGREKGWRILGRWPALIAKVTNVRGEFLGVHRTWLEVRPNGAVVKAPVPKAKKTLGPWRGGAIRLFAAAAQLDLCEGIEDALAAFQISGRPCWPCLSDGGLAAVQLPPEVQGGRILADRDPPSAEYPEGVGMHFARQLRARLDQEDRRYEIRLPPAGCKDVNDALRRAKGAAA